MNQIIKKIFNPYLIATHICRHWPFRLISDESYLKMFYCAHQGEKLDLSNPRGYNAKLQWLKLYDRRDCYTMMSDKYLVREYVKKKIGEEYLIPLLGVWDSAEEIDYSSLPNQFVLKCNHDSGSVVICRDKSKLDVEKTNKKLNRHLKKDYYWMSREYNYKKIKRKIVAEQLMTDGDSTELTDYKFFCFNGKPMFIQVDMDRFTDHIRNFYSPEWKFIDVRYGCKNDKKRNISKPRQLSEMLELAHKLSKGYPHIRVDFYVSNGHIYFGELTFHHGGGVMKIAPKRYDYVWGDYLELPQKLINK